MIIWYWRTSLTSFTGTPRTLATGRRSQWTIIVIIILNYNYFNVLGKYLWRIFSIWGITLSVKTSEFSKKGKFPQNVFVCCFLGRRKANCSHRRFMRWRIYTDRHTRPAPGYTSGQANAGRSDKVGAGIFSVVAGLTPTHTLHLVILPFVCHLSCSDFSFTLQQEHQRIVFLWSDTTLPTDLQ